MIIKIWKKNYKKLLIMVETIMGEGGIKVSRFLFDWIKKALQQKNLMILDEVQCGIGRNGKFCLWIRKIKPIGSNSKRNEVVFPLELVWLLKKLLQQWNQVRTDQHLEVILGHERGQRSFRYNFEKVFKRVQNNGLFKRELEELKNQYPIIDEVRGKVYYLV